jgi:[phosphatase 2A protein]-leucine-carboxy methyltransferase
MAIKKHKELSSLVGDDLHVTGGGTGLSSSIYSLQPADLRKPPSEIFTPLLESGILSPTLPTLFLAECVFVYLSPTVSSSLINYFTTTFSTNGCAGLVYEMFGLGTKFGKVMRDNLLARGIELLGAEEANALESQTRRFEEAGMGSAKSLTLKSVRKEYIEDKELKRSGVF